jgi:hypothetical protein
MSSLSKPPCLNRSTYTGRRVQVMMLLIMQFEPPLTSSRFSPNIFGTLFSTHQRPSSTPICIAVDMKTNSSELNGKKHYPTFY